MIDTIIVGAGAAGLFCAAQLGQKGIKVTVIDNGKKLGRKILMSGGGRCNFTNTGVSANNYISNNHHFCKSALSRFNQWDFLALINQYNIAYHERDHGQLFCDNSATDIVDMLKQECDKGCVKFQLQTELVKVEKSDDIFKLTTSQGKMQCRNLVIATGGQSMPSLGMTPIGYKIAEAFDIPIEPIRAGLVPLTLHKEQLAVLSQLSGTAILAEVTTESGKSFKEQLLFTHRGLSGPVILQISNYWKLGEAITINLLPETDLETFITEQKESHPNQTLKNTLAKVLPKRLVESLIELSLLVDIQLKQLDTNKLTELNQSLKNLMINPNSTEGYRTAEVTLGGVSTDALSSKTMETKNINNLYFIGEVVDVTGWLGGYNFQWAWSSAWACADAIAQKK